MKVYTLKDLKEALIGIRVYSLDEAEQLTALFKEKANDEVTIKEWIAKRSYRAERVSAIIEGKTVIILHKDYQWTLKDIKDYASLPIITTNQIKEYVDKYLPSTSTKKVDIERLKRTNSFTLVQCKTKEELTSLIKAIGYQVSPPDWNVYTGNIVLRIPAQVSMWQYASREWYEKAYPNEKILSFDDICIKEDSSKVKPKQNLNQQKKVKQMKKYLRVFSKGQLNVEGLFYQIAKEGTINEPRAFVRDLIKTEINRVREEVDKLDFKKLKAKFVKRYNIQAVGALETLQKIREKSMFTSASEDVLLVLSYYEFQKQKDNKVVYDWIKPYLTQKVLSSPEETVLFESKHRKVFIKAGVIKLQEANRAMISKVDIKYDRESNSFSL